MKKKNNFSIAWVSVPLYVNYNLTFFYKLKIRSNPDLNEIWTLKKCCGSNRILITD